MKNKNVLLISAAVVILLAAGLSVYFLRKSAKAPVAGTNVIYDYKKIAYNFQGKVLGKDADGLLAGGLVLLSSNNRLQSMVQAINFEISPDVKILKVEGSGKTAKVTAVALTTINIGDRVILKADGLSVAGQEAIATDILIMDNKK